MGHHRLGDRRVRDQPARTPLSRAGTPPWHPPPTPRHPARPPRRPGPARTGRPGHAEGRPRPSLRPLGRGRRRGRAGRPVHPRPGHQPRMGMARLPGLRAVRDDRPGGVGDTPAHRLRHRPRLPARHRPRLHAAVPEPRAADRRLDLHLDLPVHPDDRAAGVLVQPERPLRPAGPRHPLRPGVLVRRQQQHHRHHRRRRHRTDPPPGRLRRRDRARRRPRRRRGPAAGGGRARHPRLRQIRRIVLPQAMRAILPTASTTRSSACSRAPRWST